MCIAFFLLRGHLTLGGQVVLKVYLYKLCVKGTLF